MANANGEEPRNSHLDDNVQITIEGRKQPEGVSDNLKNNNKDYTLILKATPEHENVAFNKSSLKFIGMIDIEAPLFENVERAAIDIVCVVDTSGSMHGERISLLRKSLRSLIKSMQSRDRLAVVNFGSLCEVPLKLTNMDESGKEQAKNVVKKLESGGNTYLSGGLLEGLKLIKQRIPDKANDVCSILLFTDGQANVGIMHTKGIVAAAEKEAGMAKMGKVMPEGDPEQWSVSDVCQWLVLKDLDLEVVITNVRTLKIDGQILMHDLTEEMLEEDLKVPRLHTAKFLREIESLREGKEEKAVAEKVQQDYTINTFGYGSRHNSDLLEKLAERFDGMYYFINYTYPKNDFAICLGGLMSTVATNLQLSVKPTNGAANIKILNDFAVSTENGTVTTNLGDIQSEEKRHILFEIDLPRILAESDVATYCSVRLSYENKITTKSDALNSLMKLIRLSVTGKRNEIVDEQYNRVVVAKALQTADQLARAGQLEKAQACLDSAMKSVCDSHSYRTSLSRFLVNDMQHAMRGYAWSRDYASWGKQYSKTTRGSYRKERTVSGIDFSGRNTIQSHFLNLSQRKTVIDFNLSCSDDSSDSKDDHFRNHTKQALSTRTTRAPRLDTEPRLSVFGRPEALAPSSTRAGNLNSCRNPSDLSMSSQEHMRNGTRCDGKVQHNLKSFKDSVVGASFNPMSIPPKQPIARPAKRYDNLPLTLVCERDSLKSDETKRSKSGLAKLLREDMETSRSPQVENAELKQSE